MQFETLLAPSRTQCGVEGGSKKRVLEILANLIAAEAAELNAGEVFRALVAREKLGSTGLGLGIAIPHCRLANCAHTTGALVILKEPVDFDAPDNQPVDIICALTVPEQATGEHLQTLAKLAELFQRESFRQQLRLQTDDQALFLYTEQQLIQLST